MKTIVVLSGKGGVGKSSITGSLAVEISKTKKLLALDCDVDTPNLHLVLGLLKPYKTEPLFTSVKATINQDTCINCGLCYENCKFDAIEKTNKNHTINKYKCEGCNTCSLVCPVNAISLNNVHNADILYFKFDLITGQLKVGESGSGKIVYELRKRAEKISNEITIIDAPAGIGCPIISSLTGSDYVVAVTEPTLSAFSDLKRALSIVEHFKIPYGIIINRYDLNKEFSKEIENFANKNNIEILEKIPYDKAFVEALVKMKPIVYNKKFTPMFEKLAKRCLENVL